EYSLLAGRVYAVHMHRNTRDKFSEWAKEVSEGELQERIGLICVTIAGEVYFKEDVLQCMNVNARIIDSAIVHARDFDYDYPTLRSLASASLIHNETFVLERPQYMYMRAALALHSDDMGCALETYDALSRRLYAHPQSFMLQASTTAPFFPTSYVEAFAPTGSAVRPSTDRLDKIWALGGTVGIDLSCPRAVYRPYLIYSPSEPGVLALLKLYDAHANYRLLSSSIDAEPRPLAAAYLPIWHGDVQAFIESRAYDAEDKYRLNNIATALSVPDIFMERLGASAMWTLFDPGDVPLLQRTVGREFAEAYCTYEDTVNPVLRLPAQVVWDSICNAQTVHGYPFCFFQCNANRANNQSHLGLIRASSVTGDVMQVSSSRRSPAVAAASIALSRFVRADGTYDFDTLHTISRLAVLNCDRLIDLMSYPDDSVKYSVARTRPLAIGTHGLADTFMAMNLPYGSPQAGVLNTDIFETIYHGCLEMSSELGEVLGPYPEWFDSPASQGILHFDSWSVMPTNRFNFHVLRERIHEHGLRNSVLTAQSPTMPGIDAGGLTEGAGPQISNVIVREVDGKIYKHVRPSLVDALSSAGMWNGVVRTSIMWTEGRSLLVDIIPAAVREVYKLASELPPMMAIDMAADRAPFIDQGEAVSADL
ncbi:ribonucleotide reductase, partial [Earliella scabrosa]